MMLSSISIKEISSKDIHADMVATLGDTAPSYATTKRWAVHFKDGQGQCQI